jgi:ankyrin repeat domain-containing protein 17
MCGEWLAAAQEGNLDEVLAGLRAGIDVNLKGEFGRTALHLAAMYTQAPAIRVLLGHGADPNAQDWSGHTPVTYAVLQAQSWVFREPDPRPMELLLAAGGKLGLLEAIWLNDVELARRLCDADPNLDVSGDAQFSFHDTYLMEAAKCGFVEMVQFLLDRGADIEGIDDLGATALMRAAAGGHAEVVVLLLDRGADVNHDDWWDQTPLSEAATGGHRDIVDRLLSRGARRNLLDAVALDDPGLVADLLRGGADSNHHYGGCARLALYAVRRGDAEIVRLLLDHGAVQYEEPMDERPLLAEAARHGHLGVVELLLSRGARADEVGRDGLNALAWATRGGHAPVVEILRIEFLRRAGRGRAASPPLCHSDAADPPL